VGVDGEDDEKGELADDDAEDDEQEEAYPYPLFLVTLTGLETDGFRGALAPALDIG
jgi:hypothetical protein